MKELKAPSKELIKRILTEVDFEERLVGYLIRQRTGPTSITLYSFEEVVGLLCYPQPRINSIQLEEWIRVVMDDEELAEKIKEIIDKDISDQHKSLLVRDQMAMRLSQCNIIKLKT